jgi:hypothetical protein
MAETRLYKSRRKLLSHVVLGLTLALLCPMIVGQADVKASTYYIAGWGGTLLFGAGAAFAARELFDRTPVLVIDDRGISGPGLATMRFVPWRAIDGVTLSRRRRSGVMLTIDDERLSAAERTEMAVEKPMRDKRGYLVAEIRVSELSIKSKALAQLVAEGARSADAKA